MSSIVVTIKLQGGCMHVFCIHSGLSVTTDGFI